MLVGGKDFFEVFQKRFEAIRTLVGAEKFVALRAWFCWLCASQPTAEILGEVRQEALAAVARYGLLCAETRADLVRMAAEVTSATSDLDPQIQERTATAKLLEGVKALTTALDALEEGAGDPKLPSTWTRFPESPDVAFVHLQNRATESGALSEDEVRQSLIERVQDAQWDAQSKFTFLMLDLAAGGGHSLAVFQYLMGCLGVACHQVPLQNAGMPSIDPVRSIRSALFGAGEAISDARSRPAGEGRERVLQQWGPLFEQHAENLYRELLLRLMERRRYTTALARYGTRAELYDRDRLRQLVESNERRVEAVLAADCAKYLFDCGFDVATEFVLGNVRADIVTPDLFVEAKQVGEEDRAKVKTKVLAGYRQTLGSARRLRSRAGGIPPLALVVFVVGGARIEVPSIVPAWQNSPAVSVHVVDLRVQGQGAAERPPVVIVAEDFQRTAQEEEAAT